MIRESRKATKNTGKNKKDQSAVCEINIGMGFYKCGVFGERER